MPHHYRFLALANAALGVHIPASAQTPAANCPQLGWQEGLSKYQTPDAAFPTEDTPVGAPDCAFH